MMFWGEPPKSAPASVYPDELRWDALANELAKVVHESCPRWLLFVQGVGHCRGGGGGGDKCTFASAPHHQNVRVPTWWCVLTQTRVSARPPRHKPCAAATAGARTCKRHRTSPCRHARRSGSQKSGGVSARARIAL